MKIKQVRYETDDLEAPEAMESTDLSQAFGDESSIRNQMLEFEAQAYLEGLRDFARPGDIPDVSVILIEMENLRQEISDLRDRVDALENP